MGIPVILTPQSQADFASLVRRIAKDDPERARAFGNALIDKAVSLENLPERGRVVPELSEPSVREIIYGSYRIIYEVLHDPTVVFVLRFLACRPGHARDLSMSAALQISALIFCCRSRHPRPLKPARANLGLATVCHGTSSSANL